MDWNIALNKSRHRSLILLILIASIAFLVSCKTSNSNISNLPTTSFIETITQTPLPNATNIATPTPTMEPTLAFWATAQEDQFNGIYTRIAETKAAIATLATQFPQDCIPDFEGVFESPNGKWKAVDCPYLEGGEFHVFSTPKNTWTIPYSKVFEYYPNDAGSVDVLHWSNDEKYLYFTNSPCCPHADTLSNGNTLFVLDLQTGEWKSIVRGYFNYFLFSPFENRLVYIICNQANANTEINLHILDLSTGQEDTIFIGNFEQAGYGTWSPNGQQISLFAQKGNMYDENEKYSLVTIDLIKKTSNIIVLDSLYAPEVINWSEDDVLTIKTHRLLEYGESLVFNSYEISYYDLRSQNFISNK